MKPILIFSLYFFVSAFVANAQTEKLTKNQTEILYILNNIRMSKIRVDFFKLLKFKREEYKHPIISKRISDLLVKNLSKEEISYMIENNFSSAWRINDTATTKKIALKSNKTFDYVNDSINKSKEKYMLERISKDTYLKENIVYFVGWLDDATYISSLKYALKDQKNPTISIKMALARLKVESYHTEMLSRLKSENLDKSNLIRSYDQLTNALFYIATQESYTELMYFLDLNYTYPDHESDEIKHPIARRLIYNLYFMRDANFEKIFSSDVQLDATFEDIKLAQKWARENKGKYKINREIFMTN